jgi:UbiD family decarboxylase
MEEPVHGTISANAPSRLTRKDRSTWRDLREWLALIKSHGLLKSIQAPVSLDEELSAITFLATQADQNAPALMFENLIGDSHGCKIVTNMLGSSKERYALAVGLDPSMSIREMISASRHLMKDRVAPISVAKSAAPVNEVILQGNDIDITAFPAPKFWPGDGGPYIGTADITFTRSPHSSRINVGVYRQMVHGPNRLGMYCSPGRGGRLDREAWWQQGKPCEVVAAYGVDPVLFMAGAMAVSMDLSELDVAGGIMGCPIELTEAEHVSLPIPARAEFVIEGLLHPGDAEMEGPLGEFTGYYGNERSPQPVIEIKAIHHRRAPILTAALMARYPSSEISTGFAIMKSARILDDLQRIGVPGVVAAYTTPAAICGMGMIIVSLKQLYAGHTAQVLALTAQCPAAAYYTKWVIAVDEDVDPTDFNQVLWALTTRCHPIEDFEFMKNTWSSSLDPAQYPPELRSYGSKVLIDACKPHRHIKQFPPATMLRRATYDHVVSRWRDLGFSELPPEPVAFHPE